MTEISKIKETLHISGKSFHTALLIGLLLKKKVDDVVTDEEMEKLIGRSTLPGQPGYSNLTSAIKYILNKEGMVWKRIRGEQLIKCLEDEEKISLSEDELKRIARRSKRAVTVLRSVDTDKLTDEQKIKTATLASQHALLALVSKRDTTKKLLTTIKSPSELSIDNTKVLELFKSK